MAKAQKIQKTEELPDIFDLVLAGLLLGYSADYLRQQSIKGAFPGYQLFDDGKRGAWRVNKKDMLEWLEQKRAGSKYFTSEGGKALETA